MSPGEEGLASPAVLDGTLFDKAEARGIHRLTRAVASVPKERKVWFMSHHPCPGEGSLAPRFGMGQTRARQASRARSMRFEEAPPQRLSSRARARSMASLERPASWLSNWVMAWNMP